mmetsp:Transcript_9802/g.19269  ORF Transcript_9802/g.19269 Transcript_9802/m.19269 type:complete len:109 (+) Transcript_9802:4214-4540(+)|eukprot:CAMPEP_0204905192 /NCGR_PEP_ID=MMETSP1397-20131031/5292_1 /ASSEMBLY_ACC=CAM_ASM_000891 /TAXON_ID=49980 /ORGANISM="Climacostomum Climacostomum virens, Strain Stock W-24" /LENGTH=108 /DNA_ID=CAMNT_0052074061 /DNA_START=505 /DNA_END=831 /DNA_ORIENTATION=-
MLHQPPDNNRGKLFLMVFLGLLFVFLLAGSGPTNGSAQAASESNTKISKYEGIIDDLVKVNQHLVEQNKLMHQVVVELFNDTDASTAEFEETYQTRLKSIESRLKALE